MKKLSLRWATPALFLATTAGYGAKPVSCSHSPVVVTISDSYSDPATLAPYNARIRSDGKGAYRNGLDGVDAVIWDCPGESGDLTLNAGSSSGKKPAVRSVTFDFTSTVYTDSLTPSWLSAPLQISFINIGKLTHNYNAGGTYSFTTGASGSGFPNPNYYFRMVDPLKDTATNIPPTWNSPCNTALVNVTHYPATASSPETWIASPSAAPASCSGVYADPIQIGAVVDSRTNWSSVGQARLPFYITIQKLPQ
jgi:hypothetical protein